MSILGSEIIWRKPINISALSSNGGRMTATASVTKVKNNIWPDVPQADRDAGQILNRKMHVHVANSSNLSLLNPKVFIETKTPGDDAVYLVEGTALDEQSALGSDVHGSGAPSADITATDPGVTVVLENPHGTYPIFRVGEKVRISDRDTVTDTANQEEYLVIDTVGAPAGNEIALTFTTNIVNSYLAIDTSVASVMEPADIAASISSGPTETTASTGTYTGTIGVDHVGTMQIDWQFVFTGANTFTLNWDPDGLGMVQYDATVYTLDGANVAPVNASLGNKAYFSAPIASSDFPGVWASGDLLDFTTSPAALGLWYIRDIPVGANSLSGDKVIVGVTGESS